MYFRGIEYFRRDLKKVVPGKECPSEFRKEFEQVPLGRTSGGEKWLVPAGSAKSLVDTVASRPSG